MSSSNPYNVDLSQTENLDYPSRIDIIENLDASISKAYNVNFNYDFLEKKVYFEEDDMAYFEGDITFKIYYQIEKINMPYDVNEITYDLNDLFIPEEIQRKIPLFIKGELFEEDESSLSQMAKQEYISFVATNPRRKFSKKQSKVRVKYPRGTN